MQSWSRPHSSPPFSKDGRAGTEIIPDLVKIPTDGTDVWEIDPRLLKFENKVASGSFGDLYKGSYCSQEVAIKVLKPERVSADMQQEFAQEVYIMRKVRHKNVVQFIGACTRPPSLCIVTEFMSGGSVYDFLHKQKGIFRLPTALKVAIDVSKGMNYLHQNNIIHRDLKKLMINQRFGNLLKSVNQLSVEHCGSQIATEQPRLFRPGRCSSSSSWGCNWILCWSIASCSGSLARQIIHHTTLSKMELWQGLV